ncbi:MAG: hypothetical protein KKA32_16245 [Actinobacteria bacterium]|nr:hypothetical protein [Actinomycetota bacterium]
MAVGLFMAVVYHLSSVRSQHWLSTRFTSTLALVSVAAFLARITLAGLALVAVSLLTTLNMPAVGLAFVTLFTALNGYSLYRLSKTGRGVDPSSHVLLP